MIFKDLLMICSAEKVAQEVMKLSQSPETDYDDVLKRYSKLIDVLISQEDYVIFADEHFCFVVLSVERYIEKKNNNSDFYVSLYNMKNITDPYNTQKEKMKNETSFSWFWGQFLGLHVYEQSLEKYGPDIIVAGVLYHITYYDHSESEIGEIRKQLEKETDFTKVSQSQFYMELLHRIVEQRI